MLNILKLIILATLYSLTCGQNLIGNSCILKSSKTPGTCKLLSNCKEARDNLINKHKRSFPQVCGFQGKVPVVCCPRKPGKISRIQCKKYDSYGYKDTELHFSGETIKLRDCLIHLLEGSVAGGRPAGRTEFPHMVLIGHKSTAGNITWNCGGSIISERYILTAAHCLYAYSTPASHVRMGITDLNDTNHRQEIKVSELIAHPEYRSNSYYNDIGLIKLEKVINFDLYARPACLYSKAKLYKKSAFITGWGYTSELGATSNQLLKATVDITDHEFCNSSYKNHLGKRLRMGIVDNLQICAGVEDGSKDTCRGDSGGPLQVYHKGDDIECMYDVIGVTSFGKACPSRAGVYVRVSNYIRWIEDIVWPD